MAAEKSAAACGPEYVPVSEYVVRDPKVIAFMADQPSARCTDPLRDAITVLSNVRIENPSARADTEDAANRVALALDYLRMERDRRDHPQKATCLAHALEGHFWTCAKCVNAEALRREDVMRRA